MANLGQYIDFSVQFDLTGDAPKLNLTDTGNYPSGVTDTLKGNFIIIQPDTGSYGKMDFNNPNIKSVNGALNTYSYSPRYACDGSVQNGVWTITYTVRATGYDDTVIKKTFYLRYDQPEVRIEPDFDVFTPSLKYKDVSDYTLSGYSLSVSRSWNILIQNINAYITGSSQNIDLLYNGNYYDSVYQVNLVTTVTYTNSTYSWLSIKDRITSFSIASANTPPSCGILMDQLSALSNSCGCELSKEYVTASTLLNIINKMMAAANYDGLYENIVKYENIVLGSYKYVNTGAIIRPFVYDCGQVVVVNTADPEVIGGEVISWKVGVTANYPGNGERTFTDQRLYGKTIMFFSRGQIMIAPSGFSYNPDAGNEEGSITVPEDYPFSQGEDIIIGVVSTSTSGSGGSGGGYTPIPPIKFEVTDTQSTYSNEAIANKEIIVVVERKVLIKTDSDTPDGDYSFDKPTGTIEWTPELYGTADAPLHVEIYRF